MAFSHLRKNPFIDYKQLGLRHILYAWEVRVNLALLSYPSVGTLIRFSAAGISNPRAFQDPTLGQ